MSPSPLSLAAAALGVLAGLLPPAWALAAPAAPILAVDTRTGELSFSGRQLPDFQPATLARVLGRPDRVVTTRARRRFERFGRPGTRPFSTQVTIEDRHHVYDRLGLVFSTRNTSQFARPGPPETLYVVLRPGAGADQREKPEVMPTSGFPGTLTLNGEPLDPRRLPVPAGVDYRTARFPLFGTDFASTSRATVIDSLYVQGPGRAVRLFVDERAAGQVGYVQIR